MPVRPIQFNDLDYYHVYNQGVDKRDIFLTTADFDRFLTAVIELNRIDAVGSIYALQFRQKEKNPIVPLVSIVAYCLNPNHFHLLLQQKVENGVQIFMQKIGMSYSKYFNEQQGRRGALFQGRFKSKHVDSDAYLLHVSAYINLNYVVHGIDKTASKSSFEEYARNIKGLCDKDIVLDQFGSVEQYVDYADMTAKKIHADRKALSSGHLVEDEEGTA